jgi:hypothetical protein
MNKHLLPPLNDDKWKDPELTLPLKALVKRVTELHEAGLKVCHCADGFTLQWIHPLDRHEKLAFEYPRLVDPTHDPPTSKILNSVCCNLH